MNAPATAAPRPGPLTIEDAIPVLQAKIAEKGGTDSFKVAVRRQASYAAPLVHIATLANGTIAHLSEPETWLIMLAGGGPFFVLTATHTSETLPTVTFRPPNLNGSPREVDPKVVEDPNWRGPPDITFPSVGDKRPAPAAPSLTSFFGPASQGTDGAARGPAGQPGGGSGDLVEARIRLIEAEHRMQMDGLAKSIEAMAKATDRQIAAVLDVVKQTAQRPVEPQKSAVEQMVSLAPVITAIGGIVAPLLDKKHTIEAEERKRSAEMEARREEQARADRGEVMKAIQTASERASTAGSETMKVVTPMVAAVAQMGQTVLQQVATMRELTANPESEDGLTGIVKQGIAAFGEYMAAKVSAQGGGGNGNGAEQRQLPPKSEEKEEEEDQARIEEIRKADPNALLAEAEQALRNHYDATGLAEGFLDTMKWNEGAAKIVTDAGGPVNFFRSRVGDGWVKQNMQYVQSVLATLANAARKRGMK